MVGEGEEEKEWFPGVNVKAATARQLVRFTVNSFDEDGIVPNMEELPRSLFLVHRWFMSSSALMDLLVTMYDCASEEAECAPGCCHVAKGNMEAEAKSCAKLQLQASACRAISFWIKWYPERFNFDPELSQRIASFRQRLMASARHTYASWLDLSKVPSFDWMREMSVRTPAPRSASSSLVFSQVAPEIVAEQLTFLEYKAFRRIGFADLQAYTQRGGLKDAPKLERSIALFNGLSQWVQCMVLSKTEPEQRAQMATKFLNVSKRLRQLNNFNSLMAVVGGLAHSALARLSRTNACLSPEAQKLMADFTDLLSSSNNYSTYRRAYQAAEGFKIPVLGVHLKDLVALHVAFPDKLPPPPDSATSPSSSSRHGDYINIRKLAQLATVFTDMSRLQTTSLPVSPQSGLASTLRLSLDVHYTEDEIYELSLAREPRNSTSGPYTPTRPVVFADWVSGISPPDKATIHRHVHAMVHAVFQVYDHDGDGFISHDEFDEIAENFPFIDSFCVLDADQDGLISKAEMTRYFFHANCNALKSSFKHNFAETTYFKPTFCAHCTGLLWGLIKQGWKCKDCSINAHKHCKELVVMECRSKAPGTSGRLSSVSSLPSGGDLTPDMKRKASQKIRGRTKSTTSTQTNDPPTPSPRSSQRPLIAPSTPSDDQSHHMQKFEDKQRALERENKRLAAENLALQKQLQLANDEICHLQSDIGSMRHRTVAFILDQMDTLNMQKNSNV